MICLTNGAFAENCYILADPASRDAVLIDPGEDAALFLRRLAHEQLTLKAIWLTHAHLDHILGIESIVAETNVPVYLHPADRPLYDAAAEQGAWLGIPARTPPQPQFSLADGDSLSIGALKFTVRHVPGHSPGGAAIIGHGIAFVGDSLFAGSVGRVDLPGGDARLLITSIQEVLLTLPDDTVVYSGHGPETTIGEERRSNPFLNGAMRIA